MMWLCQWETEIGLCNYIIFMTTIGTTGCDTKQIDQHSINSSSDNGLLLENTFKCSFIFPKNIYVSSKIHIQRIEILNSSTCITLKFLLPSVRPSVYMSSLPPLYSCGCVMGMLSTCTCRWWQDKAKAAGRPHTGARCSWAQVSHPSYAGQQEA